MKQEEGTKLNAKISGRRKDKLAHNGIKIEGRRTRDRHVNKNTENMRRQ